MAESKQPRKRRKFTDKSKWYIDKEEYNKELILFKKNGIAGDRLGELFMTHVNRCASAANFKNYTYRQEMESQALYFLLKYSRGFDPERQIKGGKIPDAFAYCTQIIHNAFLQVIAKEKKHSVIKDRLIKNQPGIHKGGNNFSIMDKVD
jgi:hypothetical protein